MTAVPIRTLELDSRFALECNPAKEGTLIRLGESGALVRYGQRRHVELPGGRSFEAEPDAVTISLETSVVPIAAAVSQADGYSPDARD